MAYRVSEDVPSNVARVHRVYKFVPNSGCHPQENQLGGVRWHGPYDSKEQAVAVAYDTGLHVLRCARCRP